jgi:anti-sigma factor RsiW
MHSTCLDDETLAGYADGHLSAGGRAVVDEHIDHCHACRRLLAAVGASSDALARPRACPTPEEPWQSWLRAGAGRMASRCMTATPGGLRFGG